MIVGVTRTVRTVSGEPGARGAIAISGKLTTERDPRVKGCSGSEMGEIRSYISCSSIGSSASSSEPSESESDEGKNGSGR